MPRLARNDFFTSLFIGLLTVLALAVACAYVANFGGPAWLRGNELAVFLKLSLVIVALVAIDLCWKAHSRSES